MGFRLDRSLILVEARDYEVPRQVEVKEEVVEVD